MFVSKVKTANPIQDLTLLNRNPRTDIFVIILDKYLIEIKGPEVIKIKDTKNPSNILYSTSYFRLFQPYYYYNNPPMPFSLIEGDYGF